MFFRLPLLGVALARGFFGVRGVLGVGGAVPSDGSVPAAGSVAVRRSFWRCWLEAEEKKVSFEAIRRRREDESIEKDNNKKRPCKKQTS